MALDHSKFDWKKTGREVGAELFRRGKKIPWLAKEVAEKVGASESSRSELYAWVNGRDFSLSDKKVFSTLEILGLTAVPKETETKPRRISSPAKRTAICQNPECPAARFVSAASKAWLLVPRFFEDLPEEALFCSHCGEPLIFECESCNRPIMEGSYCSYCGALHVPLPENVVASLGPITNETIQGIFATRAGISR
jgi:hypothetical protein